MTGENLICPCCGAVQETHEPDEISAIMCLTECERCDRDKSQAAMVGRGHY